MSGDLSASDGGGPAGLFLIELVAPGLQPDGAARMAETVQHAAARLRAVGVVVSWQGGLFVPARFRCLTLLDADSPSIARRVRDIAGLSTAEVHPVQTLSGGQTSAPHPFSDPTHT